ncbi:Nucleoside diphosphate kinase-like protein 5 [Larimichthys crocea]|uniref:Uncharacterized protein n=1 Tax=Larimichthys crocea TaxID=215358 RepID=A0ACD3RCG5_LARCR|nr:Nucleoside diphosphate kinase-like protein 5 [Larimichthys crocea]
MDQTSYPRIYVERTLAVIKPDAIHKAEEIEDIILKSGFTILQKRKLQLSPEQCSDFYADQYGKLFFPSLTAFMSSGPIIAATFGSRQRYRPLEVHHRTRQQHQGQRDSSRVP